MIDRPPPGFSSLSCLGLCFFLLQDEQGDRDPAGLFIGP